MNDSKVTKGLKLFERFTGHQGEVAGEFDVKTDDVLVVVGECEAIAYNATRDGKTYSFEHDFREGSRPTLAASVDGTRLYLLGGKFKFGDRGIEDK